MKTKHTPGPWTVYTPPEMIHMRTVLCGPKYMIKNVLPQDARLIAAAPELLEALEELNRAIVAHIKPETMLVDKRLCKAHVAALKAMGKAKATGGVE